MNPNTTRGKDEWKDGNTWTATDNRPPKIEILE